VVTCRSVFEKAETVNKHLLIVGSQTSQGGIAAKAEALGLRWTGMDDAGPSEVARAAQKCRADGIYPTGLLFLEPAAVAAAELGLPSPGPAAAASMSNKLTLRSVLQTHGIRTPVYRSANSPDAMRTVTDDLGLPVIVKPVDACGSAGLWRLDYQDGNSLPGFHRRA